MRWCAYSKEKLEEAEKTMLACLKTPYRGFYVNVESADGKVNKIWTLAFNETSDAIPLVRMHGLLGGEKSH